MSHGKLILFGEHAVVYGRPALGLGLRRGVEARLKRAKTFSLRIPMWELEINDTSEQLGEAFFSLVAAMKVPAGFAAEITCDVQLPAGAGLGCSAALGVAIARVIESELDRELDKRVRILEASNAWEEVFHGNPSGIDAFLAYHGGCYLFSKGTSPKKIAVNADELVLVVAHSGATGSTKEQVALVAKRRENSQTVETILDEIGECVRVGRSAFELGEGKVAGEAINRNHRLLQELGVSTAKLDAMCANARSAGALGAKLSGAGGGGVMYALCHDDDKDMIVSILRKDSPLVITHVLATGARS